MKRLSLSILVLVMALMSLNIAAAQGPRPDGNRPRDNRPFGNREFTPLSSALDIISEAIGLDPAEITRLAVEEDMTLAEIIEANGGDVAEIEARILDELTAQSTEALPDAISNWLNSPLQGRDGIMGDRVGNRVGNRHPALDSVVDAIAEATNMEPREVLQNARDYDITLGEVATNAGADLDAISEAAKADLTQRINTAVEDEKVDPARVEELLANVDTVVDEALNTPLPELVQERNQLRRRVVALNVAVFDAAADELDMTAGDIRRALETGDTLAGYITENGGSVETVTSAARAIAETAINEAVANGRLTQEEVDEMIGNLDTAISDLLNREIQFPRPDEPIGDGV